MIEIICFICKTEHIKWAKYQTLVYRGVSGKAVWHCEAHMTLDVLQVGEG